MMHPRSYRAGARVKKASGSRSPDSSTMSTLRAMQTCPPVQVVLAPGLPEVIHQVDDPGTQSANAWIRPSHGATGAAAAEGTLWIVQLPLGFLLALNPLRFTALPEQMLP